MNTSNQRNLNKKKRITAAIVAVLGVCILTACILAAENISNMTQTIKVMVIIGGCLVFGAAFIWAVILDRAAGHYECKECFHNFQPTIVAYLLGMRSPTKRYLKCPKCGKYSYCKLKLDELRQQNQR